MSERFSATANPRAGWIAVDLDGTLADYSAGWRGAGVIGAPVPEMADRVRRWLAEGRQVRIFTARVWPITDVITDEYDLESTHIRMHADHRWQEAAKAAYAILEWAATHFGASLPITCVKDFAMVELYDDRAVQVEANTGRLVGVSSRGVSA